MEKIMVNAKTYEEQAFKILDPAHTHTVFNGEWLSKLTFEDVINLASKYTVARMLGEKSSAIDSMKKDLSTFMSFSTLLCPGLRLNCPGHRYRARSADQKFNILFGRTLQREFNQEPRLQYSCPYLWGLTA